MAGVIPAASEEAEQEKVQSAAHKAGSVSAVSLGSDALALPWYTQQSSLDMPMCCNLVCMALAVLHRMKRHHTVVQVAPCPLLPSYRVGSRHSTGHVDIHNPTLPQDSAAKVCMAALAASLQGSLC